MKVKIYYPKRAYCFSFKVPKKAYNAYFKIKYKVIRVLVTSLHVNWSINIKKNQCNLRVIYAYTIIGFCSQNILVASFESEKLSPVKFNIDY